MFRRLHVRVENQVSSAQNSVVAWKKSVKIRTQSLTHTRRRTQRVTQKILKGFKDTIGD